MPVHKRSKTTPTEWKQESSERFTRHRGVYVGYVKDNRDVQNMGRLKVHIPDMGGDPHDEKSWFICSYATPFGGQTPVKFVDKNLTEYNDTQTSYGWWAVPPDVDTQVLVTFSNGDSTRAFWFACIYDNYMNQMVPAIGAKESGSHYGPETTTDSCPLPTAEYNKYSTSRPRSKIIPNEEKRPIQKFAAEGLLKQGLVYDDLRGVSDSSARRESPSRVFGFSTPGPLDPDGRKGYPYEASRSGKTDDLLPINRKGGHQLVMDDNEDNEYIKLSTRSGAKIILNETNGFVYIVNKKGTAWVELSDTGNVDVYAGDSISIRSEKDINFRADRDVNIEGGRNINIRAARSYIDSDEFSSKIVADGTGVGGDVNIQTLKDLRINSFENTFHTSENGSLYTNMPGDRVDTFGGFIGSKASNYNLDQGGNVKFAGTLRADGSISSGGDVSSAVQSLSALFDHTHLYIPGNNSPVPTEPFGSPGGSTDATGPTSLLINPLGTYQKNNVINSTIKDGNKQYCLSYKTEEVSTINRRLATREPCVEHGTTNVGQRDKQFQINFDKYNEAFITPLLQSEIVNPIGTSRSISADVTSEFGNFLGIEFGQTGNARRDLTELSPVFQGQAVYTLEIYDTDSGKFIGGYESNATADGLLITTPAELKDIFAGAQDVIDKINNTGLADTEFGVFPDTLIRFRSLPTVPFEAGKNYKLRIIKTGAENSSSLLSQSGVADLNFTSALPARAMSIGVLTAGTKRFLLYGAN